MCTLIVGRGVFGPGTLFLGANRDESPARASLPPGVLHERPRVVGGRDLEAGGTWLALREGRVAVALLNRYDPAAPIEPPAGRRSRGLLAHDLARSTITSPEDALDLARAHPYAPFTLVFASPDDAWTVVLDRPFTARTEPIAEGWHVLTHRDLDDRREPRTAYLLDRLRGLAGATARRTEEAVIELLREHGGATPAVCLHQGRMVTVSSSIVSIGEGPTRYLHAEGRPCEHAFEDRTALLAAPARGTID